jgi:hypothetical protein
VFGLSHKGSTDRTEAFLQSMKNMTIYEQLAHYGQVGVDALRRATPVDEGETAAGWYYEIKKEGSSWSIIWGNTHVAGDTPVAILIQYGHAARDGSRVEGRDFINPALQPIFDEISAQAWKAVSNA